MSDDKPQVCANCGFPYAHHMKTTQCFPDSIEKWFPKAIADALEKPDITASEEDVLYAMFPRTSNLTLTTDWGFENFYTCQKCGAIVNHTITHYIWHRENDAHATD